MTHSLAAIDPFYAACLSMAASPAETEPAKPVYARLPLAPRNASPVPHLTSLYHFHRAGEYGDRSYPGNCGGNLIKDLLLYFQAMALSCDPMAGSGHLPRRLRRTRHPVHVLGHPSGIRRLRSRRISAAARRSTSSGHIRPTGGRSSTPTIPATCREPRRSRHFLRRYGQFIRNCARALKPGGKLAILMGDYKDREAGFVPLVFHTKRLAFACGLRSTAPTSSASATEPAAARRSTAHPSSPACMTCA